MEHEKLFTKEKLQYFLPDSAGLHLSSPLLWRVDFSPGSGQHLPGAGPQQLDAARGATPWVLHKETLPMDEAQLLPKATGWTTGWLLVVQTQGYITHIPASQSLGRITLHLPSKSQQSQSDAAVPGTPAFSSWRCFCCASRTSTTNAPALLLAVGRLSPERPP